MPTLVVIVLLLAVGCALSAPWDARESRAADHAFDSMGSNCPGSHQGSGQQDAGTLPDGT